MKKESKSLPIAFLLICIILYFIMCGDNKKLATPEKKEEVVLPSTSESEVTPFSLYDGSLPQLERYVKKTMKDPDSYEHIETRHWVMGDHMVVKMQFSGKNSFGGTVKTLINAKCSLKGDILSITEQYEM
jgi:hypothetical protein